MNDTLSTTAKGIGGIIQTSIGLQAAVTGQQTKQNWVLDPFQDSLFIILAPLLVVGLALIPFHHAGAADAASLIIAAHIVMTVAHHLPTFIRVYGDVDLLKRFKWSFTLGPIVPMIFSAAVLVYINAHGYPVEYFLYLFIVLVIWDPWHFLRQHYGFMRIYDRPNNAPKIIAARMDMSLCVTWFAFIMLASCAWLPELLHDLYVSSGITLVLAVSANAIDLATSVARMAAIAMTAVYAAYLIWCWHKRYFISTVKLALFATTFGVMYLAYAPNTWIQALAPGWTFKVGFAAVGIVHMTQYLAIVWRYNRSLASSPQRSRIGIFRALHAKGGWLVGIGYVVVCLLYGESVTMRHDNRLVMSVLLAIGFTSTLMHYYFDGFIWKVRHQQNRTALAMPETQTAASGEKSWWTNAVQTSAGRMLFRQVLYFGVPMTVLTVGALVAWQTPNRNYSQNYMAHMYSAQSLAGRGLDLQAETEARLAYAAMNGQLPFAQKIVELQSNAAREAELAFLTYNQSLYENIVMLQLAGKSIDAPHVKAHRRNVDTSIALLEKALQRNESLGHSGREQLTRDEAQSVLDAWRRQLR